MFTRQAAHTVRLFLWTLVLSPGIGWLTIQTLAESAKEPRVVKPDERTAEDPVDTQKTTRQGWDKARDFPPPIASDGTVKYDYPIVYVRVPRPYPKSYYGINHLNQAGLHQTNAPGAELRLLHPDGRDESLVSVEAQESITDPVVAVDGQWVYYARFHHMATGATASRTMLQSRKAADTTKINVKPARSFQRTTNHATRTTGP